MPTPTVQQARSHHAERAALAATAGVAVGERIAQKRPWAETLTLFATYQLRAAALAIKVMAEWADDRPASTNPAAFAGVTSYGFPISEPLISVIDLRQPAPVEALPAPWWDDSSAFLRNVQQLIESEVADAARSAAQVEMNAQPGFDTYVRLLVPPSCKRCVVLAGVQYSQEEAFDRHDLCDCVHVPVSGLDEALERGLVMDAVDLVKRGEVRGLSAADTRAILDGADISTVVNATRGTSAPGITNASVDTLRVGRDLLKVKTTTYGVTKRSAWRKANPSQRVRLRPEAIYQLARDHDAALRLLQRYGYLSTP